MVTGAATMPSTEQDYLMRALAQLAQALRVILKLRKLGKYEEALLELANTSNSLVGLDPELMIKLDAESLTRQLGRERIIVAARLLAEAAEIQQDLRDSESAWPLKRRALELTLEALLADRTRSDLVEQARTLLAETGSSFLDDRYEPLLEMLGR
jgi:hypothetical protein